MATADHHDPTPHDPKLGAPALARALILDELFVGWETLPVHFLY